MSYRSPVGRKMGFVVDNHRLWPLCYDRSSSASRHIKVYRVFQLLASAPVTWSTRAMRVHCAVSASRDQLQDHGRDPSWVDCITFIGVPPDGLYFCTLTSPTPAFPQGRSFWSKSRGSRRTRAPPARWV